MDGGRFDCVTRALAVGTPRRTMVTTLVAGTLVAMLGGRAPQASAAACREFQRKCNTADQCCGGKAACRRVTKLDCQLGGKRCCGTKGSFCDVTLDGCDCCGDLVCNPTTNRCNLPPLPV